MMIPIPRGGVLERVNGIETARAVPGIEDVTISMHQGQRIVPLPEGSAYLGFIFSCAPTPAEASLRRADTTPSFTIVSVIPREPWAQVGGYLSGQS
jgi:hypothetical protein